MLKLNIFADGGSRGNPGVAGAGTAVYDAATGELLREIVYAVGPSSTNNVAEYHGLLRGLEAATELGADEVYMFMDSKLVVEQMSGRWKIKHPDMQKLAMEAKKLAAGFQRVAYTWVPRAQNTVADKLSNDAMDAVANGHGPGIVGGGVSDSTSAVESDEDSRAAQWLQAEGEATRLIVVRHGQTEMSAANLYSGHSDPELDATGRKQADAVAAKLKDMAIDVVISSPLARCQQTAMAIAQPLGLEVLTDKRLIECDFGEFEARTAQQAEELDPDFYQRWLRDPSIAAPGGESIEAVYERVSAATDDIVAVYRGKTVVLVSHVMPIKSIVRKALQAGPGIHNRLFLALAAVSVIDVHDDEMIVRSVGATY